MPTVTQNGNYDKEAKDFKAHANTILPLRIEKETKLSKNQYMTFKLRTDPANVNSPIYEYTARYINGDEGARNGLLQWKKDIIKICYGQNITSALAKISLAQQLLKGEALSSFN